MMSFFSRTTTPVTLSSIHVECLFYSMYHTGSLLFTYSSYSKWTGAWEAIDCCRMLVVLAPGPYTSAIGHDSCDRNHDAELLLVERVECVAFDTANNSSALYAIVGLQRGGGGGE